MIETVGVIARPEGPWQSPAFERFEITASAFGLLAMTTTKPGCDTCCVLDILPEFHIRSGGSMRIIYIRQ